MTPLARYLARHLPPVAVHVALAAIYAATLLAILATLGSGGAQIIYLDIGWPG